MEYRVLLDPVSDETTVLLLAKNLASYHRGLTFAELKEALRTEQVLYRKAVSSEELREIRGTLEHMGVRFTVVAAEEPRDIPKESVPVEKSQSNSHSTASRKRTLPPQEAQEKSSSNAARTLWIPLGTVAAVILGGLLFLIPQEKKELNLQPLNRISSSGAPTTEPRQNNSPEQKKMNELIDSATIRCGSSALDTEKFYRMALGINPKNFDAWFGLLACYRCTGTIQKAEEIEDEIRARFGASILDPDNFLRPYGTIESLEIRGGAVTLVLRSSRSSVTPLYSDLYQISRRFTALAGSGSLSILVKMGGGSGIFLQHSLGGCSSYSQFVTEGTWDIF